MQTQTKTYPDSPIKKIENKNPKWTIYFDEDKHKFYKEDKKTRIQSVSAVPGIIDKSGAMMGWAVKCMGEYVIQNWDNYGVEELVVKAKREYRNVSKEACDIGTEIHKWIELYIAGKKPDIPNDEKISNGIMAFLQWEKKHKPEWILSEQIIYNKELDYAGILDAVAIIDGKRYLIDFKSSKAIYPEMFIQTAGYRLAYEEMTKAKIDACMIIRLGKEDGEFETAESKDMELEKELFIHALNLGNKLKKYEKIC